MIEKEQHHLDKLRSEVASSVNDKKLLELAKAEKNLRTLQDNLSRSVSEVTVSLAKFSEGRWKFNSSKLNSSIARPNLIVIVRFPRRTICAPPLEGAVSTSLRPCPSAISTQTSIHCF